MLSCHVQEQLYLHHYTYSCLITKTHFHKYVFVEKNEANVYCASWFYVKFKLAYYKNWNLCTYSDRFHAACYRTLTRYITV